MSTAWFNVLAAYEFKTMDLVLLLGVLLVLVALMMRMRKRRKRVSNQATPREQLESLRQQSGVRGDLERLMVEIEQLAKRLGAQLDAKTVQLEKTMREAEAVIARLEAAQHARPTDAPAPQTPAAHPTPGDEVDPFTREVCSLADQGMTAKDIAGRLEEHIGKVELVLALRKA